MQIKKISFQGENFGQEFIQSMKETGFAVISGTPITTEEVQLVQDNWRAFFHSEDKHQYTFTKEGQTGYFPYLSESAKDQSVPDLKEFFHIYFEENIPQADKLTWNLRSKLYKMGLELLSFIEADLKTTKEIFQETVESADRTLFRIIYYPKLNGDERGVRAAAHEDINLITLLPAQSSAGLEAKAVSGEWVPVEYEEGDLVVNVGDMLQMFSRGEYISTTHRVVNPNDNNQQGQQDRIAMPLFVHPSENFDLGEMTAGAYLEQRLKELGIK